jgi:hypothetical protein
MHNADRRDAYARQKFGLGPDEARTLVDRHITAGTEDTILTPAQLRRTKHKRAGPGAHRRNQRNRRREAFLKLLARYTPYAAQEPDAEAEDDGDQPES